MILIIGQRADPHVAAVCSHIEHDVVVFDAHSHDTLHFDPRIDRFTLCGAEYAFSDISCMWWRLKWPDMHPKRPTTQLRKDRWDYWKGEYQATLISLSRLLRDVPKVNDPIGNFIADHKPYQLAVAVDIGFNIPDTRVTNDYRLSLDFVADLGERAVLKRISTAMLESEHDFSHLGLSLIDASTISDNQGAVEFCPSIIQREVTKAYELRVVAVGERIFSVQVMSQGGAGSVDWRRNQYALEWREHDLPGDMKAMIFEYLERLGLQSGVFDFSVSPNGAVTFFECNPEGQWLWLEKWAEQPISSAFAELLMHRAARPARAAG